jgi:hypothetical protein
VVLEDQRNEANESQMAGILEQRFLRALRNVSFAKRTLILEEIENDKRHKIFHLRGVHSLLL